jgi:hypothetical protein
MNKLEFENWDYNKLSSNKFITWDIIINNLHKPWDFKKLSCNSAITWDNIVDTPFLRWNWSFVTINPNITFEIIDNNILYNWDFNILKSRLSHENYLHLLEKSHISVDYSDDTGYESL